jgi:hypothetical protein
MADSKAGKLHPSRWAVIYMLALMLAAVVWVILVVVFGGTPWTHPW